MDGEKISPPIRLWIGAMLCIFPVLLSPSPLVSASWGFQIDPPEGYRYTGGDGKDRFSFQSSEGTNLDIVIYAAHSYPSVTALAEDIQRRLKNQGETDDFVYRDKQAALLQLRFLGSGGLSEGWGLCIELDGPEDTARQGKPLFLALAYGPLGREDLQKLHFSALDSIAPTPSDRLAPGPITEYQYPRGERQSVPLAGLDAEALVYEHDREAAQALVDREFQVLRRYAASPLWREAWTRFYRAVYRDSFDRLANIAFALERYWNIPSLETNAFAGKVLSWVQNFAYERDLMGSDFVNPVSAALEGRGDCDSRSLLWAVILKHANIPSAIMVSSHYSHAMGLADVPGTGAHFNWAEKSWLVAEPIAKVSLGFIAADMSEIRHWMGIVFE